MAEEQVSIIVGNYQYSMFLDVEVEAGAKKSVRSFSLEAAEPPGTIADAWPFQPGNACTILAGGDLLLSGYIDDYEPEIDCESHKAKISGRSKGADAVDSSATHPTGRFDNKDMGEIAKALDMFNIGYTADIKLDKIPFHQIVPGATVFQELDVLGRSQGVLQIGNADGTISLTRASEFSRHAGALVEGFNIKSGKAKLSVRHKHSKVTARGQRWKGDGKDNLRLAQTATDQTVKRFRPKIIIAEGDTDMQRLKARAQWHIARQSGFETTATVTVYGWRDEAGTLWDPKKLIYVKSQRLKIDQDMAIQQVTFKQSSESGTIAILSLVDPQALGGKDVKGSSNSAWATGGDDDAS